MLGLHEEPQGHRVQDVSTGPLRCEFFEVFTLAFITTGERTSRPTPKRINGNSCKSQTTSDETACPLPPNSPALVTTRTCSVEE